MPRERSELEYRKAQHVLGKLQVALQLASEALKMVPDAKGLEQACSSLFQAKGDLQQRVFRLEGGN